MHGRPTRGHGRAGGSGPLGARPPRAGAAPSAGCRRAGAPPRRLSEGGRSFLASLSPFRLVLTAESATSRMTNKAVAAAERRRRKPPLVAARPAALQEEGGDAGALLDAEPVHDRAVDDESAHDA